MKTKKPKLPSDRAMRVAASELFGKEGEIEVDDDAVISRAVGNECGGAYVASWVWVDDTDAAISIKKLKNTIYKRRMA